MRLRLTAPWRGWRPSRRGLGRAPRCSRPDPWETSVWADRKFFSPVCLGFSLHFLIATCSSFSARFRFWEFDTVWVVEVLEAFSTVLAGLREGHQRLLEILCYSSVCFPMAFRQTSSFPFVVGFGFDTEPDLPTAPQDVGRSAWRHAKQ